MKKTTTIEENFFVLAEILFQLFMQDLFMHKKGIIYKENQYKYKIIYKIMPILQQIKTMYEKEEKKKMIEKLKKLDEKLIAKYSEIGDYEGGRTLEKDIEIGSWFKSIQYCELVVEELEGVDKEEWRIKNIEDLLVHLIILKYRSNREKLRKVEKIKIIKEKAITERKRKNK